MRRLHNLAVLAGDAHGILRDALPSRGVAEVHVNFRSRRSGRARRTSSIWSFCARRTGAWCRAAPSC